MRKASANTHTFSCVYIHECIFIFIFILIDRCALAFAVEGVGGVGVREELREEDVEDVHQVCWVGGIEVSRWWGVDQRG